jgi:lipoprotein-releasing system permease protein
VTEGRGFHWFVAMRYLSGARHPWSRALVAITGFVVVVCVTLIAAYLWGFEDVPRPRGNGAQWAIDPMIPTVWSAAVTAAGLLWMVGRNLRRRHAVAYAVAAIAVVLLPLIPDLPPHVVEVPVFIAAIGAWLPTSVGDGRKWFVRVVTLLVLAITAQIVMPHVYARLADARVPDRLQLIGLGLTWGAAIVVPVLVAVVAWWDAIGRGRAVDVGIAVVTTIAAALLAIVLSGQIVYAFADALDLAPIVIPSELIERFLRIVKIGLIIAIVLSVFFLGLTILRRRFSFFSTVSIAGVWIGTMALVIVLSVMSGFESDLRQKILGSNAHIQVSRDKGDFTEWEAVKQRVESVPGVIASTPFAVSEVVIAASNNYFNVIIKGIDRPSMEKVTKLLEALECQDERGRERECNPIEQQMIMAKLEPIEDDSDDRIVPQDDEPASTGDVLDEAPADMVDGTDPIDFSGRAVPDEPPPPAPPPSGGLEPPTGRYGGDAPGLLGLDAPPAPPGDPEEADADADDPDPDPDSDHAELRPPPIRGLDRGIRREVNPDGSHTISVTSADLGPPTRRTLSLPGVLVGRELTKQINLWEDQEVRMVSPLSDPANPDATGTPIPFNRDYRVAGTFFTGMYEYDLKYVYVTLESLQDFLDRGDAIDGLEIRIGDPDATDETVAALQRTLGPEYRVQGWQELNRSLFSALKLEKIAMFLVLAIIILVASFSIIGTLVMVVVEKGKEIALLKTLGSSDRGVTWIFVTQGFFIGLIGSVLGVGYGLFCCLVFDVIGIPIDADVYYIDELPLHVDLTSIALIGAAGLVISVAATIYPALVASRLPPSVGLRH